MTTLLDPSLGAHLLREGPWQCGFEDLTAAGVVLRPEQLEVFTVDAPDVVMVAWPLPDPREWVFMDEVPPEPLEIDGRRYTVPVLAEVDWLGTGELELAYADTWRRFPSVPVRPQVPDYVTESFLATGLRYARAWDITTIPDSLWGDCAAAFEAAWSSSTYSALRDLYAVINDTGGDDCWLADRYRGPVESHRHVQEAQSPHLWRCVDGEETVTLLADALLDDDLHIKAFELPLRFANPLVEFYWKDLVQISMPAAEQALLAVPPWLRAELREEERLGGRPWA